MASQSQAAFDRVGYIHSMGQYKLASETYSLNSGDFWLKSSSLRSTRFARFRAMKFEAASSVSRDLSPGTDLSPSAKLHLNL